MSNLALIRNEDDEREARIDALSFRLGFVKTAEERAQVWGDMKAEILARSPFQIARLEKEKGLDHG